METRKGAELLAEFEVEKLIFDAPPRMVKDFPAYRVARQFQAQESGTVDVYPEFAFRPQPNVPYPVLVRVFRLPSGKLHGVASPLPEAVLSAEEMVEPGQMMVNVVWKGGRDKRKPISQHPDTGIIILPTRRWLEIVRRWDTSATAETEPHIGGKATFVVLMIHENKFIAIPVQPSVAEGPKAKGTAIVLLRSTGNLSDWHKTHVLAPGGTRWVHVLTMLGIRDLTKLRIMSEKDIRDAFKTQMKRYHPDKVGGEEVPEFRKGLARDKSMLLEEARETALAYIKERDAKQACETLGIRMELERISEAGVKSAHTRSVHGDVKLAAAEAAKETLLRFIKERDAEIEEAGASAQVAAAQEETNDPPGNGEPRETTETVA